MSIQDIINKDETYYMNTFGKRTEVAFESGEGMNLYTKDKKVYKDFLGGIAVNCLGHAHPTLKAALHEQIDKVLHTSSLYYIENQSNLAKELVERTCADKAFFCSTGAEANEGAIKLAKIYFHKKGENRYEIISLNNSFHGRTLATVAATGQKKYQEPYKPLTPGFIQVDANDFDKLKEAVNEKTAAIILEPIQGEAGVYPMDKQYLKKVRKLCDEKNIILIFDEVQTGMGRCGSLFCYMQTGVEPDIFTTAKALGGGVPIGAVCAKSWVAKAFEPGDHGTTFGGNPFSCAAGLAVFKAFDEENIVENSKKMGEYFMEKLEKIKQTSNDKIKKIRGAGLLIGIDFGDDSAVRVHKELFKKGFLTSVCKGTTIRLAPPLIIKKEDIDDFINALKEVI